jgi:hypothetical protein
VAWTDMAEISAFVMIAAGRSLFRFEELLELSRLFADSDERDRRHRRT